MRIWLSRSSEVPLREQLQAQIILGILSNDLKAGQRLPSVRQLARRHTIHSNTVSAAYRALAESGWVHFRKGSGVYVRVKSPEQPLNGKLELDHLISMFLKAASDKDFSLHEIQARLSHWLALQPPDHFLVIEPDPELRQILIAEIEEATNRKVIGVGLDECSGDVLTGSAPLTLYSHVAAVRSLLPADKDLITLRSRSIPESIQGAKPPPPHTILAIVSRWSEFLRWSRTMLVAAGLDPNTLTFRDARVRGWDKGLRTTAFVITDALMLRQLPPGVPARVFRIISDASLDELRTYVKRFFK